MPQRSGPSTQQVRASGSSEKFHVACAGARGVQRMLIFSDETCLRLVASFLWGWHRETAKYSCCRIFTECSLLCISKPRGEMSPTPALTRVICAQRLSGICYSHHAERQEIVSRFLRRDLPLCSNPDPNPNPGARRTTRREVASAKSMCIS